VRRDRVEAPPAHTRAIEPIGLIAQAIAVEGNRNGACE